jgi:hypothetical protein
LSASTDDADGWNAAMAANVTPMRARPAGGGDVPQDGAEEGGRECPVTPLGHHDGVHFFFDPRGQVRALNPTQIANRGHLDVLFFGVLAWCEARKRAAGVSDWDDIRILLRRSTDDGVTWSAPRSIASLAPPPNPPPRTAFDAAIARVSVTGLVFS